MKDKEKFVAELRRIADVIEAIDVPQHVRLRVDLWCHGVETTEDLQALKQLAKQWHNQSHNSHEWLKGKMECEAVEVTAHHPSGLLASSYEEKVVRVPTGDPDLSFMHDLEVAHAD